jgi:hypothetical protein
MRIFCNNYDFESDDAPATSTKTLAGFRHFVMHYIFEKWMVSVRVPFVGKMKIFDRQHNIMLWLGGVL